MRRGAATGRDWPQRGLGLSGGKEARSGPENDLFWYMEGRLTFLVGS